MNNNNHSINNDVYSHIEITYTLLQFKLSNIITKLIIKHMKLNNYESYEYTKGIYLCICY